LRRTKGGIFGAVKKPLEIALVSTGVAAALFVCIGSAVAVWGFSGFRGEVCSHLGELPRVVERTGRLTRCDQLSVDGGSSVFELEGAQGRGRAFVESETDGHGNVLVNDVRFVPDGP
jgi:hypothetical protein